MAVEIPKVALQVLTDLTGEPRFEAALLMTLRDTVEHRLEKIAAQREPLEKKYGVDFAEFKRRWDSGQVPNRYSYEVEKDFLEWEGLNTRESKLQEISGWLA